MSKNPSDSVDLDAFLGTEVFSHDEAVAVYAAAVAKFARGDKLPSKEQQRLKDAMVACNRAGIDLQRDVAKYRELVRAIDRATGAVEVDTSLLQNLRDHIHKHAAAAQKLEAELQLAQRELANVRLAYSTELERVSEQRRTNAQARGVAEQLRAELEDAGFADDDLPAIPPPPEPAPSGIEHRPVDPTPRGPDGKALPPSWSTEGYVGAHRDAEFAALEAEEAERRAQAVHDATRERERLQSAIEKQLDQQQQREGTE